MHKCCVAQRGLYATEVNKASDFVGEHIANPLPWKPYPACLAAVCSPQANIHALFTGGFGQLLPRAEPKGKAGPRKASGHSA